MQLLLLHIITIVLPLFALEIAREKGSVDGHGLFTGILKKDPVAKTSEKRTSKEGIVDDGSQSVTFIVLGSRSDKQNSTSRISRPLPDTIHGAQSHYSKTHFIHSKQRKSKHGVLLKEQILSANRRKRPIGNPSQNARKPNNILKNGTEILMNTGPSTQRQPQNHKHASEFHNKELDISSGISENDFKTINSLDDVQENLKNILNSEKEAFDEKKTTKTRGNIVKAIDHIDDIQDAYDKGLMSDDAFDQVDNADKGTLSDYFSAIDKGENNQETAANPVSTATLSAESSASAPNKEDNEESKGYHGDFYDAIDQGQLPSYSDGLVAHRTKSVSKTKGSLKVEHQTNVKTHSRAGRKGEKNTTPTTNNQHSGHQLNLADISKVMSVDAPENEVLGDGHSSGFGTKHLLYNGEDVTAFVHPLAGSQPFVLPSVPVRPTALRPHTLQNSKDSENVSANTQSSQFFQNPHIPVITQEPKRLPKIRFMKVSSANSSVQRLQSELKQISKSQHSKGAASNFHLPGEHSVEEPLAFTSVEKTSKGTTITGGKISGGRITGGLIQGGHIKSGFIEGGVIRGGRVEGGRIKNGTMEGGAVINGVMKGGRLINGSIEGGLLEGGNIYGGKIKGGKVDGGNMRGGVVEGGRLSGGNMQGGVLKGGEMQSGNMKGGSMEGGILKGGNIEGGSLKFGNMFGGTLKSGFMLGGKMTNGTIDGGTLKGGTVEGGVLKGGVMEGGQLKGGVVLAGKIRGGIIEGGVIEGGEVNDGVVIKGGIINGTVTAGRKDIHHIQTDPGNVVVNNTERQNNASSLNQDTMVKFYETYKTSKLVPLSSAARVPQTKEGTKMFDKLSFGVPTENVNDLISEMKGGPKNLDELVNYWNRPSKDENSLPMGSGGPEKKINPTKPRSSVMRHENKDNPPKRKSNDRILKSSRKWIEEGNLKPTYHWSLSELIGDRIPGSPGAAMITHGKIKSIRGGLSFNGYDAWLGGGDFAGGCISDPDRCADGLSFEMTLKLGAETARIQDISYIVDSGASTFTSKGFTLYTWRGDLRADIAVANKEFCLKTPANVGHWQDVLITWSREEGMRMYVNCQLKAQTKGDEHCLGCRTSECHVTDTNTRLMIGRPNFSPHFHCSRFDSGDITFWERYLRARDISSLCRSDTAKTRRENFKGNKFRSYNVKTGVCNCATTSYMYQFPS